MKSGYGTGGAGRSAGGGESQNPDNRGRDRPDHFRPVDGSSGGGPGFDLGAGRSGTGRASDSDNQRPDTNNFRLEQFPLDPFREVLHHSLLSLHLT